MPAPSRSPDAGWLTLPNAFTVVRFLLIVPIAWLIVTGQHPTTLIVLVAVFGGSDWIDGFLARALGQESLVGQVLDPFADRLGIVILIASLLFAGALPWWPVVAIVAVDAVVGVVAAVRFAQRDRLHVSWVGKIRTALIMASLVLVVLGLHPAIADWVSATGVVLLQAGAALHIVAGAGYIRQLVSR